MNGSTRPLRTNQEPPIGWTTRFANETEQIVAEIAWDLVIGCNQIFVLLLSLLFVFRDATMHRICFVRKCENEEKKLCE